MNCLWFRYEYFYTHKNLMFCQSKCHDFIDLRILTLNQEISYFILPLEKNSTIFVRTSRTKTGVYRGKFGRYLRYCLKGYENWRKIQNWIFWSNFKSQSVTIHQFLFAIKTIFFKCLSNFFIKINFFIVTSYKQFFTIFAYRVKREHLIRTDSNMAKFTCKRFFR